MNAEQLEINNRTVFRQTKNMLYALRCKLSEAQQAPDEYAQCYVNELQQAIISLEAVDAGLVRPVDPNTSKRYMKYVPFWA